MIICIWNGYLIGGKVTKYLNCLFSDVCSLPKKKNKSQQIAFAINLHRKKRLILSSVNYEIHDRHTFLKLIINSMSFLCVLIPN